MAENEMVKSRDSVSDATMLTTSAFNLRIRTGCGSTAGEEDSWC
ncbi:hypothetical protein Hdeb2414_s0028g00697591 [Helianthus debilis subsp. tardiflorus]